MKVSVNANSFIGFGLSWGKFDDREETYFKISFPIFFIIISLE
jgi:hypothetical protein